MRLPNMLCIGAAKCGTSTLWGLLDRHPDIFALQGVEVKFFADPEVYARGIDWYREHFRDVQAEKIVGEHSNQYCSKDRYPGTAERIHRHLPDAKLIYIVRHPLRQIESAWLQRRRQGTRGVSPDFSTAVLSTPELISYVMYRAQVAEYLRFFRPDQLLVLFAEDLAADARGTFRRCFEFLGVDPGVEVADGEGEKRNVSEGSTVESASLDRLRRVPGFAAAARLVPVGVRKGIKKRFFRQRWTGRPQWDPRVLREVQARIRDDAARFLEEQGKSADFWRLEPAAVAGTSSR